mmetsp:Transcript_24326/g.61783  ORF Transcript_24326/g.61783 Transcript_24326/m.61783 type:complete len:216 (-) Transcript_24326:204-851(-)
MPSMPPRPPHPTSPRSTCALQASLARRACSHFRRAQSSRCIQPYTLFSARTRRSGFCSSSCARSLAPLSETEDMSASDFHSASGTGLRVPAKQLSTASMAPLSQSSRPSTTSVTGKSSSSRPPQSASHSACAAAVSSGSLIVEIPPTAQSTCPRLLLASWPRSSIRSATRLSCCHSGKARALGRPVACKHASTSAESSSITPGLCDSTNRRPALS